LTSKRPWCITRNTDDHRKSAFLFHSLSVSIQWYNVVVYSHSLPRNRRSHSSICLSVFSSSF